MPTVDATTLVKIDQSQILDWAWALLDANPDARIYVAKGREVPSPPNPGAHVAVVWLQGVSAQQSSPTNKNERGAFQLMVSVIVGENATHDNAIEYLATWALRRLFPVAGCTTNTGLTITPMSYSSSPAGSPGDNPKILAQDLVITLEASANSAAGFNDTLVA